MPDEELAVSFLAFPADGERSYERSVVFGPEAPDITVLIEANPVTGHLSVTVGNGPDYHDMINLVGFLRSMAGSIEDVAESLEYQEAVEALRNE